MSRRKRVTIVTYNGVDGACAAAMALLRHPEGDVVVSSARTIGSTFERLKQEPAVPASIQVCGVGMYGNWDEVARHAEELRQKGAAIVWYCGRGYLDGDQARYAAFCQPVFLEATSNTGAICEHLKLANHPDARFLLDLAKHDPGVSAAGKAPSKEQQFWLDLVAASTAEYFKYRDPARYAATVRKLAEGQYDEQDHRLVEVHRRHGVRYALTGKSAPMRELQERIRKCAAVDQPVLILGESGVGKEHVAHLIHQRGRRATEPFLAVNCAVFAGNLGLANSTLFGHKRGAFTDARADREGAFVAASGGVLFLDELGELPLDIQAKLLRVVEDQEIIPEGADRPTSKADVQLIAATGRDLPAMIRRGRFRADLFYRLSALRITVPPLRDRPDDLDTLIDHTLTELANEGCPRKLTAHQRRQLHAYDWPGNVRQLIQSLRRIAYLGLDVADVLAEERRLGLHVHEEQADTDWSPGSAEEVLPFDEVRRRYAQRALSACGGSLQAAARALDVSVNTLKGWLAERPKGHKA